MLRPDVLTLDRHMPVCDGDEVLAALASLTERPVVVMVTTDLRDEALLLRNGASAVIEKAATIDRNALIAAVRGA